MSDAPRLSAEEILQLVTKISAVGGDAAANLGVLLSELQNTRNALAAKEASEAQLQGQVAQLQAQCNEYREKVDDLETLVQDVGATTSMKATELETEVVRLQAERDSYKQQVSGLKMLVDDISSPEESHRRASQERDPRDFRCEGMEQQMHPGFGFGGTAEASHPPYRCGGSSPDKPGSLSPAAAAAVQRVSVQTEVRPLGQASSISPSHGGGSPSYGKASSPGAAAAFGGIVDWTSSGAAAGLKKAHTMGPGAFAARHSPTQSTESHDVQRWTVELPTPEETHKTGSVKINSISPGTPPGGARSSPVHNPSRAYGASFAPTRTVHESHDVQNYTLDLAPSSSQKQSSITSVSPTAAGSNSPSFHVYSGPPSFSPSSSKPTRTTETHETTTSYIDLH